MILCVTLNPSWDVTHVCRGWQAGGVVRAEQTFAFAAGTANVTVHSPGSVPDVVHQLTQHVRIEPVE